MYGVRVAARTGFTSEREDIIIIMLFLGLGFLYYVENTNYFSKVIGYVTFNRLRLSM